MSLWCAGLLAIACLLATVPGAYTGKVRVGLGYHRAQGLLKDVDTHGISCINSSSSNAADVVCSTYYAGLEEVTSLLGKIVGRIDNKALEYQNPVCTSVSVDDAQCTTSSAVCTRDELVYVKCKPNKRLVNGPNPWEGYVEQYDRDTGRYRPYCLKRTERADLEQKTQFACSRNGFMGTEYVEWIGDLGIPMPENADDRKVRNCPDTKFVYMKCKRGVEVHILLDVSESLTHKAEQKWMKQQKTIVHTFYDYMTSSEGSKVVEMVDMVTFTPFNTKLLLAEQVGFSPGFYGDLNKLNDREKAKMELFKNDMETKTPKGLTDIGSSLKEMAETLDKVHYKKAVIVIASDFLNMKDDVSPVDVVAGLTKEDVLVYPIILDTKHKDTGLFEAIRDASLHKLGYEAADFYKSTVQDLFSQQIFD